MYTNDSLYFQNTSDIIHRQRRTVAVTIGLFVVFGFVFLSLFVIAIYVFDAKINKLKNVVNET